MSTNDSPLEAISQSLERARDCEKEGNISSALRIYKQTLARLSAESPLKKEIEIIIKQLEDRLKSASETEKSKRSDRQPWKLGVAFLAGLLLMGIIAIAVNVFNADSPGLTVTQSDTVPYLALQDATSTQPYVTPQNTTSTPETSNTSPKNKIILTIKANHVYLKAGPNLKHSEVSEAYQKGTEMEVLGMYKDWFYVKSPRGENGWLWKGWVTIDPSLVNRVLKITQVPTPPSQHPKPTKRPPYP